MARWLPWAIACALLLAAVPGLRAEDKYFDSGGVKIRYTDQGQGEPVLLIHGFGANLDIQWALPGIVGALAKDHRVIAYDNRGHGKSGKPHDPKAYGMALVEDPVRLLDHLKIKKAHVVGYSMGAMIAAKLLTTHPDRLRTATLGGGGPAVQDEKRARFAEQLAESLEQGKGIGPLLEALTPAGKPKPSPEQIKTVNQFFTAFNDTKSLAAVVRSWQDLVVAETDLKTNRIATLALIGANDPLRKGADTLRGRMANVEVVVIPDADHMTAFARPRFLETLEAFLDAHRTDRKAKQPAALPAGGGM